MLPETPESSPQFKSNGISSDSHTRSNSIRKSPLLRNGSTRTNNTITPTKNNLISNNNNLSNDLDNEFVNNNGNEGNDHEYNSNELDRCSREVLISFYSKQSIELNEFKDKFYSLEELKGIELKENLNLSKTLDMANNRIDQLLNDQYRMEEELAGRIEVLDKLRTTVKDANREKRDAEKRYRDQSESFDAERKAWLDQESHYNLRISNLSSAPRKARLSDLPPKLTRRESDPDFDPITDFVPAPLTPNGTGTGTPRSFLPASPSTSLHSGPSPNELILQEQLNSLTTSNSSLTLTLRALSVELSEIKRVYQNVQEENESYEIMLGERTLNGEIRGSSILRRSWTQDSEGDGSSLGGIGLESVGEDSGEELEELEERDEFMDGQLSESEYTYRETSQSPSGRRRRRPPPSKTIVKKLSGGLDLGAELEAAQMSDNIIKEEEEDTKTVSKTIKKHKKEASSAEDLRAEIKSLKEANKALTLYVSKIVDKVCSLEGFEKVLAVDYLSPASPPPPTTPQLADHSPLTSENGLPTLSLPTNSPITTTTTSPRHLTTPSLTRGTSSSNSSINSTGTRNESQQTSSNSNSPPVTSSNNKDRSRKTLSLGWDSVSSVFASALSRTGPIPSATSAIPPAGFKPFMLNTSDSSSSTTANVPTTTASPPLTGGKKYETDEDEDDRKERERLRAEMTLYGFIDPAWKNDSTTPNSTLSPTGVVVGNGKRMSGNSLLGSPNIDNSGTVNFRRNNGTTPSPIIPTSNWTTSTSLSPSPNLNSSRPVSVESVVKSNSESNEASSYTDIKPRRQRPLSIARTSTRSIVPIGGRDLSSTNSGGSEGSVGLGIGSSGGDLGSTRLSPRSSPLLGEIGLPLNSGLVKPEGEDAENWSKKLKRMSLGWGGNQ